MCKKSRHRGAQQCHGRIRNWALPPSFQDLEETYRCMTSRHRGVQQCHGHIRNRTGRRGHKPRGRGRGPKTQAYVLEATFFIHTVQPKHKTYNLGRHDLARSITLSQCEVQRVTSSRGVALLYFSAFHPLAFGMGSNACGGRAPVAPPPRRKRSALLFIDREGINIRNLNIYSE